MFTLLLSKCVNDFSWKILGKSKLLHERGNVFAEFEMKIISKITSIFNKTYKIMKY